MHKQQVVRGDRLAGVLVVALAPMVVGSLALAQQGVQINTDVLGLNIPGDAANEPSFAIDPTNPLHMVAGWRQFPTNNSDHRLAGYAVTLDGGWTWFNGGTLDAPEGSGNADQTDPVVKFDHNGVVYYNSMIYRSSRDGQTVYRSPDGGFTWDLPNYLREDCFCDKNWYAIDDLIGFHYGIWQIPGEFARSTDGGQTWQSWNVGASVFAFVNPGPDSEIYIGWWGNGVKLRRSDNARDPNATPTFTSAITIPFGDALFNFPINPDGAASQINVVVDPREGPTRGWVYMATSANRSNDICEVMFARSTDGGLTFSTPIRVNDDLPGNDYQWMAAMSMAPSGRLDAVWLDTRDDPNHFISRLYYANSYDGGLTWSRNRAVGDPWDPSLGYPGGQRKIGDYFQCQSDNGSISVVHPATFNGEQDIYYQRLFPLVLEASPLIAGQPVRFEVSEARPNQRTWIVYSLAGPGYTNIALLDVPVNLARPRLGVGPRMTDVSGQVSWTATMPPQSQGQHVWFQAIQRENASNVVDGVVQ